jgi:geranylgeranyl diphosphate synthase type I
MDSLQHQRDRVEARLDAVLDGTEPAGLREQVRHVALSGGKRVRPTLTMLVCDALDGDTDTAVDFAVGIELVHSASLAIDDIIDESELRRGTPAAWTTFGHGPAILASDGLLGEAFALLATDERAMRRVSEALFELGQGEATELADSPDSEEAYLKLARRKTGALFRAAAELGAIAADADDETTEAFGQYAESVGVAFQMRDDVLDATADPEQLGKPTGNDAEMDRPSIVEVTPLSPEEANERARETSAAALDALDAADVADSEAKLYLEQFAGFVIERER